jgi:hypothetical protein
VILNERDKDTNNVPVPDEVIFTSPKSAPFTVKLPVEVLSGDSARYATPETNGDGNDPVEVKLINTPVDGEMVTVGTDVYPVPDVIRLRPITSPENAVIAPVAGVARVLDTVYVNVVADGSFTEEIIVPTAGVGREDDTSIVNVVTPVT